MKNKKRTSFVIARLPNAGLGNKLLVWARAFLFAQRNQLPLVVVGWTGFQLSPLLLGRDLRWYWNYFRDVDEVGLWRRIVAKQSFKTVIEPKFDESVCGQGCVYEFRDVPHWSDYFADLKPSRDLVRSALFSMLSDARKLEVQKLEKPIIAIQVRMGDFRPLAPGEDFAKVGQVRTPLNYFCKLIANIREIHGSLLPVTLFSDGQPSLLQDLLAMPGVKLASKNSAIADICLMASSKVLVPSAGSTFGYWGGFLGDCALIMHPDHTHSKIRSNEGLVSYFEGIAPENTESFDELLKENIRDIRFP